MKLSWYSLTLLVLIFGCSAPKQIKSIQKETVMYPINEPYEVTSRRVKQGEKEAVAVSDRELRIAYFASNTTWKLGVDIQHLPSLETPKSPLIAALYNMALEEAIKDIRPDKTFMAGEKWNGVWTRDISYSVDLALAALFPEVSVKSLFAKVDTNRQVIIQDTGTGGSWPVSTDRVVWSLAAKQYFLWHRDREFLSRAYEVMKNTALADRHAAYDRETGLYYGESSFMDWREQSYASWMSPVDIYMSFSFSTCVLHYHHLSTLAWMAEKLGRLDEAKQWKSWAEELRIAIRTNFIHQELGTYASYLYPSPLRIPVLKTDNLGLALAVLTGVVSQEEAATVVANIPVVPFGVVCLWPQQPHAGYYHNKGIWPFVNAYYVLAAREAGNLEAVSFGIGAMARAAAFFGTHKENFSYDRGHVDKMAVNSDRQLWSVAGYLAVVQRVIFGISVDEKGLFFRPMIPTFIEGPLTLKNLRYLSSTVSVMVEGTGDTIEKIMVNGNVVSPDIRLSGALPTNYTVVITMKRTSTPQPIRMVSTEDISLNEPKLKLSNTMVTWKEVKNARLYTVFWNGKKVATTPQTTYIPSSGSGVINVQANPAEGILSSCLSAPIWIIPDERKITLQLEDIADLQPYVTNRYKGYSGDGYVLLDNEGRVVPKIEVNIPRAGTYLVRFRYANGNGPVNTDNRCAIRTLLIDNREQGVMVFPQRGVWTEWGYSSHLMVKLTRGKHTLTLVKHALDENMNGKINHAALDSIELVLWE
ncbi:alpha-L-rhamnosidase-related protein [Thermospira aquatica]|uniref:CBM6 domain-containing protein n=1 Tax=Thermospira aquatica TaxID=2828656 RepID=A0AAX3BDF2_9SPIR|nr:amylo-alpha-1,6-glucosidase [Thermospira aquatica]URA10226.1 hypothetical protein KDW03_12235 [Thermospira aquatica]